MKVIEFFLVIQNVPLVLVVAVEVVFLTVYTVQIAGLRAPTMIQALKEIVLELQADSNALIIFDTKPFLVLEKAFSLSLFYE